MSRGHWYALSLAGLLLSPSMALAQETPTAPTTQTATTSTTPAQDPDEVVCHAGEPIIGSRIPGARVCHTRKQWDQMHADAERAIRDQQQRGLQAGAPNGGG